MKALRGTKLTGSFPDSARQITAIRGILTAEQPLTTDFPRLVAKEAPESGKTASAGLENWQFPRFYLASHGYSGNSDRRTALPAYFSPASSQGSIRMGENFLLQTSKRTVFSHSPRV